MLLNRLFARKINPRWIYLPLLIVFFAIELTGCGGGRLIPRDLKDFVAADLKTERRRVELTQPFRTKITLRINPLPINDARQAERDLIQSCVKYFQRDAVHDFINDTLVFVVRLDNDPDINIRYMSVADDMRMLNKDSMTLDRFIERCIKEENWSDALEE